MVGIEEIAPHAKEMACEKEMVCCVRGYQVYKDIGAEAIGEVLVCSREQTVGEIFVVKLYSRKKNFVHFLCTKIFIQRKKKRITVVQSSSCVY